MKSINNHLNHPKRGDRIKVDPIRDLKDIQAISKLTASNPRDHLLWTMGINNGLRTCDLLRLKVKDVCDLRSGDSLTIKESKTGKDNVLMINKSIFKALQSYLDAVGPGENDYLGLGSGQAKYLISINERYKSRFFHALYRAFCP